MDVLRKVSSSFLMITISLVILIGGIVFYFFYYAKKKSPVFSSASSANSSNQQAELMLFYVDWCPHCKTAKPIWEDFKSEYQSKTINGYHILFTEVNCTNETAEIEKLITKYNIEGYPTIKLIKDGQIIDFDAKPTKETLVEFLNTAL